MKFKIERAGPDKAETAFIRKNELSTVGMHELALELWWSTVSLEHSRLRFEGTAYALGFVATLLAAIERLSELRKIEVVLDASADWLVFELSGPDVRILAEAGNTEAPFVLLKGEFRKFSITFINDLFAALPALANNRDVLALRRRLRALN